MENCVDVSIYNARPIVTIKQPGSVRHVITNQAMTYIQMSFDEAVELMGQLESKFRPHRYTVLHDELQAEPSDPCAICDIPKHYHR
jgi:hypothetical protein